MVCVISIIIINVPIENNSGIIFVIIFTGPVYTSSIHLVTPELISMGFHQLKKIHIINFKQTCHQNSSFLLVEREE